MHALLERKRKTSSPKKAQLKNATQMTTPDRSSENQKRRKAEAESVVAVREG